MELYGLTIFYTGFLVALAVNLVVKNEGGTPAGGAGAGGLLCGFSMGLPALLFGHWAPFFLGALLSPALAFAGRRAHERRPGDQDLALWGFLGYGLGAVVAAVIFFRAGSDSSSLTSFARFLQIPGAFVNAVLGIFGLGC